MSASRSVTCPRCGHAFPLADPGPPPGEDSARARQDDQQQARRLMDGVEHDFGFVGTALKAALTERIAAALGNLRPACNPVNAGVKEIAPSPALLRAATAVCEALRTDELACRLGPLNTALRELDHVVNPRPRLEPTRGAWNPEEDELNQRLTPPPAESATLVAWHPGSREVPVVVGRAREAPDA